MNLLVRSLGIVLIGAYVALAAPWKAVRIGIDGASAPMAFYDTRSNMLTGFDVELAREAGRRLHWNISFVHTYWSRIFRDLQEQKIDLIWSGMCITAERQAMYAISSPYYESKQLLVVAANSPLTNKQQLRSSTLGYIAGSASQRMLHADPVLGPEIVRGRIRLRAISGPWEGLVELAIDRIDAFIVDDYILHALDQSLEGSAPVRILPGYLGKTGLGVAARKSDSPLISQLDSAFADMAKDGTLQRLHEIWFNPIFEQRLSSPQGTP